MFIKQSTSIKCPRCEGTNKTILTANVYRCNQCGQHYDSNQDNYNGLLVESGKANATNLPILKSIKMPFFIVIGLLLIYSLIKLLPSIQHSSTEGAADPILLVEEEGDNLSIPAMMNNGNPRVAYVFYQDQDSGDNYLYKANFLSKNDDEIDANVVSIQNEDGKFIAYDSLSHKVIPNFSQLIPTPLSPDAAVLYADKNSLIIKNKVNEYHQLEMIDPYTGNISWTISSKELPGVELLTGKYSEKDNMGIELFRYNFSVKLPPYYYLIDKKGQIIGFGEIN